MDLTALKFVGIGLVVVSVISIIDNGGTSKLFPDKSKASPFQAAVSDPLRGAQFTCREYIKRQLHDPKSAEFDRYNSWPATMEGDVATVHAAFRARNGFGALRVGTATCTLTVVNEDAGGYSRWSGHAVIKK